MLKTLKSQFDNAILLLIALGLLQYAKICF